eukprot:SAG31_NODE_16723_length_698_cov_1.604341_1_plen_205_part_10
MAAMDAQITKLNEMLKIAQADVAEAQKEAAEAKASNEAVMVEGRKAQEDMEKMAKQREQEKALALRAVGELKTLRGQLVEKDTVIAKAAERIKDQTDQVEKALAEKATAENTKAGLEDEISAVTSKLHTMETKLAALQNMGGGSSSAAAPVDEAAEAAKLEAALAAAGDDEAAKAAVIAAHEEACKCEDPLQAVMQQIDTQQKEL